MTAPNQIRNPRVGSRGSGLDGGFDKCPRCDSDDLTTTAAGLDWLVTCNSCGRFERLTDAELRSTL